MSMTPTPAAQTHEERLRLARAIGDRAFQVYGGDLVAVGLYGSMARAQDGPYSDIEMYCILRTPGAEFSHEWVAGPWKAEVEGRWPLTHGSVHDLFPLHDPEGYFAKLRAVAQSRTAEQFRAAVEGVLTGEMYEFVGKLRNLEAGAGTLTYLPSLAVDMAWYGAYLIGLHNRRYYTSGGRVLEEALTLPGAPAGFAELARLVAEGRLSDREAVTGVCNRFWEGVVAWAEEHGYRIVAAQEIPF